MLLIHFFLALTLSDGTQLFFVVELASFRPVFLLIWDLKSVDAFFKNATREESWMDDQERAEAQRFKQLVAIIKENLSDVKVFLPGANEADAFIVGRTESGWAGLRTKVVQT
jgi:hypothetical protein